MKADERLIVTAVKAGLVVHVLDNGSIKIVVADKGSLPVFENWYELISITATPVAIKSKSLGRNSYWSVNGNFVYFGIKKSVVTTSELVAAIVSTSL